MLHRLCLFILASALSFANSWSPIVTWPAAWRQFTARTWRCSDSGNIIHSDRMVQPCMQLNPRKLNEFGHFYTQAEEDITKLELEDMDDVHEMLRRRLVAKTEKDYDEADWLQDQLRVRYGVTLHEGKKLWRADGLSWEEMYKRVGSEESRATRVDEREVVNLILDRKDARAARDYSTADYIVDILLKKHGVALDDKKKTWRFVGDSHDGEYGEGKEYALRGMIASRRSTGKPLGDYQRAHDDDTPVDPELLRKVETLLSDRLACKKKRRFEEADEIQYELQDLGVQIDDKLRLWYFQPGDAYY